MNTYMYIKNKIIEKYPTVIEEYTDYINTYGNNTITRKMRAYVYLLNLLIFHKNSCKKIHVSEYEDSKRDEVNEWIALIQDYDVVSFDVFDTLIFRNVEKPEDIFKLVGIKLDISGFREMRKKAEHSLYEEKRFYTIFDIYECMKERYGLDADQCMQMEFDIELCMTVVNPYMKKIYDAALEQGKQVIFVSDMYWSESFMEKLLKKCGYSSWNHLIVSCDWNADKYTGSIYRKIQDELYPNKKIVHFGDNYIADVVKAKESGIRGIHYKNIYSEGKKYRCSDAYCTSLGVSISNALVNQEIHSGITELNDYEQYGYIYGGRLVAGYCHWLNDVAKNKNMDQLIFLARDADVIYNAYKDYYMEVDCEYAYVSRSAMLILTLDRYPDLFIEKILKRRAVECTDTINKTLTEIKLDYLIPHLSEVGLKASDIFDTSKLKKLELLIYTYKTELIESIGDMREAACKYWRQLIGNHKQIGLVDIEWRGTIMLCLKYFLKEVCQMDVTLYNLHIGTKRDNWTEQEFDMDYMLSYCFSSDVNKEQNNFFAYEIIRVSIVELLFSSCDGSLLCYMQDEAGNVSLLKDTYYKENDQIVKDMHSGVLKFVRRYKQIEKQLGISCGIPGEDAIRLLLDVSNSNKYIYRLFENYMYCSAPGRVNEGRPMREYFKENHYI